MLLMLSGNGKDFVQEGLRLLPLRCRGRYRLSRSSNTSISARLPMSLSIQCLLNFGNISDEATT